MHTLSYIDNDYKSQILMMEYFLIKSYCQQLQHLHLCNFLHQILNLHVFHLECNKPNYMKLFIECIGIACITNEYMYIMCRSIRAPLKQQQTMQKNTNLNLFNFSFSILFSLTDGTSIVTLRTKIHILYKNIRFILSIIRGAYSAMQL